MGFRDGRCVTVHMAAGALCGTARQDSSAAALFVHAAALVADANLGCLTPGRCSVCGADQALGDRARRRDAAGLALVGADRAALPAPLAATGAVDRSARRGFGCHWVRLG